AIDIINRNVLNFLKNIKLGKIKGKNKLIERLIRRGYVFDNEIDEQKELLRMYKLYEKIASQKERFVICPTYNCNLNCTYCFQNSILNRNQDLITKKVLNKCFETINKIRKSKKLTISIYGGEPLISNSKQIDVIKDIIRKCEDSNYKMNIVTNGVELYKFVDILSKPFIKQVQVTLDGTKKVHDKRRIFRNGKGTFDLIVKSIDAAIENNIRIAIRVNVDSNNINNLPELANFIIEKGWDKRIFSYIAPVRQFSCKNYTFCIPEYETLAKISRIYEKYKQTKVLTLGGWQGIDTLISLSIYGKLFPPQFKNCEANVNMYAFDLYGDIYTCLSVCGNKEFSIGKFYPKLKINKSKLNSWRKRTVLKIPECRNCKFSLICGGGCPLLAFYKKGSMNKPYCKPIEEALKIGFSLYFKGDLGGNKKRIY
ncbi:MAG: radical SAM protein, partial [Candidatus Aenigmatarchaeota archaeon]